MKVLRFLAAGLPGFLVAVLLNAALIEQLDWRAPLSYAVVLLVQVSINFFVLRRFVFDVAQNQASLWSQYSAFLAGIGAFRAVDWLVFSGLVALGLHFLAAQLFSVVLFSLLKLKYSERVIEGSERSRPRASR